MNATYYTYSDTPAGTVLLTGDGTVTTGIYWKVFKRVPKVEDDWVEDEQVFGEVLTQLDEYFKGTRTTFSFPYEAKGTAFQKSVWKELEKLGYGAHASYQAIANAIGNPKAVRAVGTAVGSNPLSIVVPCHRVLTSSNAISGYAGGTASKAVLLNIEKIAFLT